MNPIWLKHKEEQWQEMLKSSKEVNSVLLTDRAFECEECGEEIDYDSYMNSDEECCCPFCGMPW